MPFIQAPLAEVKEDVQVPEGEYDLRVVDVKVRESEKDDINTVYALTIAVESDEFPNAQPVRHWLTIPKPSHEYADLMWRSLKRFLHCFGIPFEANGFDDGDLEGATGRCFVGVAEPDEQGNTYNELRLPRLPQEEDTGKKSKK